MHKNTIFTPLCSTIFSFVVFSYVELTLCAAPTNTGPSIIFFSDEVETYV